MILSISIERDAIVARMVRGLSTAGRDKESVYRAFGVNYLNCRTGNKLCSQRRIICRFSLLVPANTGSYGLDMRVASQRCEAAPERPATVTFSFVNEAGAWRLAAIHSSVVPAQIPWYRPSFQPMERFPLFRGLDRTSDSRSARFGGAPVNDSRSVGPDKSPMVPPNGHMLVKAGNNIVRGRVYWGDHHLGRAVPRSAGSRSRWVRQRRTA